MGMSEQAVQWIEARGISVELAAKFGLSNSLEIDGGEVWRLLSHVQVDEQTGCWNWMGRKTRNGYGIAQVGKSGTTAHRRLMSLLCDVPANLVVDHLCSNRACLNPTHLEVVTQRENTLRAVRKDACPQGHPYDDQNRIVLRNGHWRCRECHRARELARYHHKKAAAHA